MNSVRDALERFQALVYVLAIALAAAWGLWGGASGLDAAINPALAFMLYVTFLQVPVAELRAIWRHGRFVAALLVTNFVAIPLLVWGLSWLLPSDPLVRLGVLLVLLAPCIDYVVTFAHMGKADSRLLLACTPMLLLMQMLLLPVYLHALLGEQAAALVRAEPFVEALVSLIVVPLLLAWATQRWAAQSVKGQRASQYLGLLPVPATALVLWLVVASVIPQLDAASEAVWQVLPVYVAFAVLAPVIAWRLAKAFGLAAPAARAVAFSGSTRNALVVLPLALAVPGAMPVLPVVIVTQTLVELVSELIYVQRIAKLQ
jgi:arsenite transporter